MQDSKIHRIQHKQLLKRFIVIQTCLKKENSNKQPNLKRNIFWDHLGESAAGLSC